MNILRALKESFRDSRLQMAAPLALFIGIEQAFIYADFSKVGQIYLKQKQQIQGTPMTILRLSL